MSACRGKLTEGYPKNALGPLSDVFVPQKWFSHFYAIGCLSNACMLSAVYVASRDAAGEDNSASLVLLVAFQLHLVRRLVETVCMMRYPKEATMHVMAYAFGMSYYVVVPFTLYLASRTAACTPALYAGMVVFCVGSLIQWHSHYLLSILGSKNSNKYVIPQGGLFALVSCPHYFGEVVIYLGLGIACGIDTDSDQLLKWYPFVWVAVNLTLAARMTHKWYLGRFPSYNRLGRRALVPFVL